MTADNYIIFNNLIIGQTANDRSAGVNTRGQRIELQFMLIRLITWRVSLRRVCALLHAVQTAAEGKEEAAREAVKLAECEEEALKCCFLCLLSSFNTGSESVLLIPPGPWCVW